MKLVLATRNEGKVVELKAMLEGMDIEVSSLADHDGIPEIVEDGDTFLANARKKARAVAEITGEMALADDSGLAVEALGGAPGVNSARFAGTQGDYKANNEKLLRDMEGVANGRRQAAFVCTMVLAEPKGEGAAASPGEQGSHGGREWDVDGRCEGEIVGEYRGEGGFGYDPLFYVPGERATMAELSMERKNEISHRGKALRKMKEILVDLLEKRENS